MKFDSIDTFGGHSITVFPVPEPIPSHRKVFDWLRRHSAENLTSIVIAIIPVIWSYLE